MKISIDELRAQPQQRLNLNFKESIEGLNAVKPVLGDLVAAAHLTSIHVSGNVQTLLKLTCHRCLGPYFLNINLALDENILETPPEDWSAAASKEKELTAIDFVEYLAEDGTLDITDLVYQAVTLATPVTCLCGEDCPGPAFPDRDGHSSSLNSSNQVQNETDQIDPRWKNLKSLFSKQDTDAKS